nr:tyrosine--tRNA ligase 1, cytoplasmic-like [Tanacetum cinerariifolium]
MDVDEKLRKLKTICEECIQKEELKDLLTKNPEPVCFDEFEPFDRMHIAQGIMKTININKLTCWLQSKDMDIILIAAGMDMDKVEFIWSTEEINSRPREYWETVMDFSCRNKLLVKMGQSEQTDLTTNKIFYACMRCADIVFTKADICQIGMDQRNVGVITRELCDDNKPIKLLHYMLPGLLKGQEKMSKSDASFPVFMDDNERSKSFVFDSSFINRPVSPTRLPEPSENAMPYGRMRGGLEGKMLEGARLELLAPPRQQVNANDPLSIPPTDIIPHSVIQVTSQLALVT